MRVLIENGADVNILNKVNNSALILAVKEGRRFKTASETTILDIP